MRSILKHFLINTATLYLISQVIGGIGFARGMETVFLAGLVLSLATMIVRPILNLLLLPLNLITFGLFKWVTYAITLYLVTLVVPGFTITNFTFAVFNSYCFSIPAVSLTGVLSFVAFSFLISSVSSIIYWIFK